MNLRLRRVSITRAAQLWRSRPCAPPAGTPVGALLSAVGEGGAPVDPASVLVLAVHDAAGRGGPGAVAPDLPGLINGLVATALQARGAAVCGMRPACVMCADGESTRALQVRQKPGAACPS